MKPIASVMFLVVAAAVAVEHLAVGLPAPGKTDAAKIQKNMAKNKAKKSQEVLQFGNQQNRQAENKNYARAEKRQAPDDHHDPEPVPEVNNALDRYSQPAKHEKIAELFYNPDSYGPADIDDRYRRNAQRYRAPIKRSPHPVYRSRDNGRAKRDLDIDPEDLLALMTIMEAERKQKAHEQQSRSSRQRYGHLNEYEIEPYMDSEVQDDDEIDDVPEGWLEGPILPSPMFVTPKDYYLNNGYARKQRAPRGSKNDYFQSLNRMQNEPLYYKFPEYYLH